MQAQKAVIAVCQTDSLLYKHKKLELKNCTGALTTPSFSGGGKLL